MSKLLFLLPIYFIAGILITGDREPDKLLTVEGGLQLFGNEPFTIVALVTDHDERYFLIMDDEEASRLWREKSGRIRITGKIVEKTRLGEPAKFLEITCYEWVHDED